MNAKPLRWQSPAVLGVLVAQACAALADSALLIVAIALLEARHAPEWSTPALRAGFYASYVLLAPFAGRWADAWPKGKLMMAVNVIKLVGVIALAFSAHPLMVFAVIGCGAAAYAPARYGMLPEITQGRDLVQANAAMEIVTIVALIGGFVLGSFLVESVSTVVACCMLGALYAAGAASALLCRSSVASISEKTGFRSGVKILLRDPEARNALVLTSIFWAAAAVLQFLMIAWSRHTLGLSLSHAAFLPAIFAVGMVGGAVVAGTWDLLSSDCAPLVCAIALGGAILLMPIATSLVAACLLLAVAGVLAGLLLVPMNAELQQRGAMLMQPGLSVAVQNFFENGLSIFFLAIYGAAVAIGVSVNSTIYVLGFGVIVLVGLSKLRGRIADANQPRTHA